MTHDEWDKMEKVPGKRFFFRRQSSKSIAKAGIGTAISYFKYSVRLKMKEGNPYYGKSYTSDEQFSCEQVEEAD